jgi:hypothetical protein
MPRIIVPKVTFYQVLIVPCSYVTLGSMKIDHEKAAFSARLNEICDEMNVPPKGQARQTTLARIFDVTQKGARKWLEGEGYPALDMARRIAVWSNVCIEWLLSGRGPKRFSEDPVSGIQSGQIRAQSASTHAALPDEGFAARYHAADAATKALIDIALAAPSAPLPDGLSPSLRILVDMVRTAIRSEQEKK